MLRKCLRIPAKIYYKTVLSLMTKHLYATDFMGIKGRIKFDHNGDILGDVQYDQVLGELC